MRARLFVLTAALGGLGACSESSGSGDETPWDAAFPAPDATRRDAGAIPLPPDAAPSADPDLRGLALNEVAAAGAPSDWFELYNGTPAAVDLSALWFAAGDADAVRFPVGSTVAAGGYFVQRLDDEFPGFKLGKSETLTLFDPQRAVLDRVAWQEGDSPEGGAYARVPDGTGGFRTVSPGTPGAANRASERDAAPPPEPDAAPPAPDAAPPEVDAAPPEVDAAPEPPEEDAAPSPTVSVVVNEIAAAPEDWIELANPGPAAELGGFTLNDSDPAHVFVLPPGTRLERGGHLLLTRGAEGFDFGLGDDDAVELRDPAGRLVDALDWAAGEAPSEQSYGRFPDAVGAPRTLARPTPGAPNEDGPPPMPRVVINEIVADAGHDPDWFELYNAGDAAAELSGWTFTDSDPAHVAAFAQGTVLAAGAWLLVEQGDAFDFGLGAEDQVSLFDAGGELVDTLAWQDGDAPRDASYGRLPDGDGASGTRETPTPGAANE